MGPKLLKAWRVKRGITQTELAKLAEISQVTVSLYESAQRTPTVANALALQRVTAGAVPVTVWV